MPGGLVFLVLTSTYIAACSAPPRVATYRGEYVYNFERSLFTVQGSKECWSLSGDMSKAELPSLGNYPSTGLATVELKGVLGPRGRNLGACTRVLTVTEIVEVSNMRRE